MSRALWRVRVITTERTFAPFSADLILDDAQALQRRVIADIAASHPETGFVHFPRSSGNPVDIRAREVLAVEVIPPARPRAASTDIPFRDEVPEPAPAPVPPSAELSAARERRRPAAAGPGTQFLQSLEGQHPQVQPVRRGGTR